MPNKKGFEKGFSETMIAAIEAAQWHLFPLDLATILGSGMLRIMKFANTGVENKRYH